MKCIEVKIFTSSS